MSPQCSSRLSKASKKKVQKSPKPKQNVSPDKPRGQTRRTQLKDDDDCKVDEDDGKDLIDLITGSEAVGFVYYGLDESDENAASDCSSIASGPSVPNYATFKKPKSSQALCSACRERYQKATRTKAPIKNKLLDNDPRSLTCDQWVLIKRFRSRRQPESTRKLLRDVQLDQEVPSWPAESPICSRMHIFLRRNLRRVTLPARRKKRRSTGTKRRRDGPQGCRVAKQQRLDSHANISAGSERRNNPKADQRANPDLAVEVTPSPADLKPTKQTEVGSKQVAEKKTTKQTEVWSKKVQEKTTKQTEVGSKQVQEKKTTKQTEVGSKQVAEKKTPCGFRKLLAQLQSNSSMIVREKR